MAGGPGDATDRWSEMQAVARAAVSRPAEIMEAVSGAPDRAAAAAAIADILQVAPATADQLIDMSLARFIGRGQPAAR